jgi:hypothetical protein
MRLVVPSCKAKHRKCGKRSGKVVPCHPGLADRAGPEDPLLWLRAVLSKHLALGAIVDVADSATLLRKSLDLADFLRPDVLLNALRQQSARLLKYAADNKRR